MEVITMESAVWQQMLERMERIEKYVRDASEPVTVNDDELWVDNNQACRLLCVEKRTMQYYRSEGKIHYSRFGKQLRYRLSDIEEFAHITIRPLSKKMLEVIRKECMERNKELIENMED